jgi:hypothetical protein
MPGAAIIASALNTAATRSKGLWVGGVDVIIDPVAPIDYAVPIESVRIEHQGPGGVSSMEFTIECYTVPPAVTVADGMDVRFYDFTNSRDLFYGFVDHVDVVNLYGDRGTVYHLKCVGIEALLDWSVMAADITFAAGIHPEVGVQSVFANAVGTSLDRLNATASSIADTNSNDTNPVMALGTITATAVTITAGTTLREAIRLVGAQVLWTDPTQYFVATVDFRGGLRWFWTTALLSAVDNWGFTAINNDSPSTSNGEDTTYGIDAAQYRGVFVKGTGVTAFVPSGAGKEGPIAFLNDTNITTLAVAIQAGISYLVPYTTQARGTYALRDKAPAVNSIPGGKVTITDTRLGLSATVFAVSAVMRTFNASQREDWIVAFGGLAPSMTGLARQLTRTTLS